MDERLWKSPGILALVFAVCALAARAQQPGEQKIVDLANQARAEAGLAPLQWDGALAAAARTHAQLMAADHSISHRYQGEPDLAQRASQAGARFSLVEENVAAGYSPQQIHNSWMHSPGHHDNLMNPKIDRIGVALILAQGMLYAVADYAQSVEALTPDKVEARIGALLRQRGLTLVADQSGARKYCSLDSSGAGRGLGARFLMRWQTPDLTRLPPELESRIASGQFRQAAVGSCEAGGQGNSFSSYRVAVLLY